jgi:hypothetical protein
MECGDSQFILNSGGAYRFTQVIRLYQAYRDKGLLVVGVHTTWVTILHVAFGLNNNVLTRAARMAAKGGGKVSVEPRLWRANTSRSSTLREPSGV